MIGNVLAVAGKELLILLKDRGALVVLFLLPLVLASVFGSINQSIIASVEGTGEEAMSLPVQLVNLDSGRHGEWIETTLKDIATLEISTSDSVDQANQAVIEGDALAAIVIPDKLTEQVDAYEPSTIQVIVDPTQERFGSMITGIMNEVVTPVILQGEIQYGIRTIMDETGLFEGIDPELRRALEAQNLGVVMTQLQKMQEEPWIAVSSEDLAGIEAEGPWNPFSYTVPSFTVMFSFFLVGTVAQSIWLEKERGSFRRLLAAPIHRASIIAGKILAYILVVCLQVLLLFGVGSVFFDMPLGNSPLGLALLTLATALTSTSLGILLAALTRTSRQADTIGIILGFALAALGGCIGYPLYRMEGFLGLLSRLSPHAHALIGFSTLMDGGGGLVDILPQFGILLGIGGAFFLIGMWRFKFD